MPMKGFKLKDKSSAADALEQKLNESPLEAETRNNGNFADIEAKLSDRYSKDEMSFIDKGTGLLLPHQSHLRH